MNLYLQTKKKPNYLLYYHLLRCNLTIISKKYINAFMNQCFLESLSISLQMVVNILPTCSCVLGEAPKQTSITFMKTVYILKFNILISPSERHAWKIIFRFCEQHEFVRTWIKIRPQSVFDSSKQMNDFPVTGERIMHFCQNFVQSKCD